MRLSSAEKQEIIELVDRSEDGVNQTLKGLASIRVLFINGIVPGCKKVLTD